MFRYFFFIVILTFYLVSRVWAQQPQKIKLINSDVITYQEGTEARKLLGNVAFQHEGAVLYCDSAYHYADKNSLDAFSNIRIKQGDSLNVFGDLLKYNGNTRVAELHGNVRMTDGKMTLTTPHLNYNMKSKTSQYYGGGHIVDTVNTLDSKTGFYYTGAREFFFKDSVVLVNPDYIMRSDTLRYKTLSGVAYFLGPTTITSDSNLIYCENGWYDTKNELSQYNENAYLVTKKQKLEGDSLFYNRNKRIGEAFGNVTLTDTVDNIILKGGYAIFQEFTDDALITGQNTQLIQVMEDDSLFLHADTLSATLDSTGQHKVLYAYHGTKFFKSDLQGKCDSLIYSFADSTIKMFVEPVLWSDENQLTAEYLEIYTYEGEIKEVRMHDLAMIIIQEDTAKFNQIKGRQMTGYFKENELKSIRVIGNGETIYYAKEENDKVDEKNGKVKSNHDKYLLVNKTLCTNMLINISNRKVDEITFYVKPDAHSYPLSQFPPNELRLKGFKWLHKYRPLKKEDIFN